MGKYHGWGTVEYIEIDKRVYEDLQARAGKRLKLLRICEENMDRCPVCLQLLIPDGEHDGLCKLAKELAHE